MSWQGWPLGERGLYYGWVMVASSFITIFMVAGVRNSFGVFFPHMLNDFGWSRAAISLAMSISSLVGGVCLPVVGGIVDRYGPRVVIFVSTLLLGTSVILLSATSSIWHLYLLYGVIGGISMAGAAMIPLSALIARWFERRRGLALSLYSSGWSLGQMIIIPLTVYVILLYNWQTAFQILGILLLAVILPTIVALVKDKPEEMGYPHADAVDHLEKGVPLLVKTTPIVEALKTPSFLLLCIINFCCGFTDVPILTHLAAYASDVGLSKTVVAEALSLMYGASFFGVITMGSVSDRFGRRKPLIILYTLRALSLILPLGIQDVLMLNFFAATFGFVLFSMNSLFSSWIGDAYGTFSVGRLMGVASLIHGVGAAIGTYFFGVVFDLNGSYNWAFLASICLAFTSSMCALLMKERKRF